MLTEPELTNLSRDFGKPPEEQNPLLQSLGTPHIDSFNYLLEEGLFESINNSPPVYLSLPNGDKVSLWLDDVTIHQPEVPISDVKDYKMFPSECRQRGATYKGKLSVKLGWSVNGKKQEVFEKDLGNVPIMVKSNRCHLRNLTPAQLVAKGEHEQEWGGYFIIKGFERLVRMLVATRRNYPIAIQRSKWKSAGLQFSDLGVMLRSTRDDNSAVINILHYVTDGSAKLMFVHKRNSYYIPLTLMLKCLMNVPDVYIYKALLAGCGNDHYYKHCVMNMLRSIHEENLHSHKQCKAYIGKLFRVKFTELPPDATDIDICDYIIKYV